MLKARPEPEAVRKLWDPGTVRRLARDLGDVAAEVLTVTGGPVRRPGAEQWAQKILRGANNKPDLVKLVRGVSEASLAWSHPRYGAQQVAAPIPRPRWWNPWWRR